MSLIPIYRPDGGTLAEVAVASCEHPRVIPPFDPAAARGLARDEVRKRWPRYHGSCPDCDFFGTLYASWEHYLAGDW